MAGISVFTVAPAKDDPPFNPYVLLWLSQHSENFGRILLSHNLMTEAEIDATIDLMIVQLEKARKKAKKELQKAKNSIRIKLEK